MRGFIYTDQYAYQPSRGRWIPPVRDNRTHAQWHWDNQQRITREQLERSRVNRARAVAIREQKARERGRAMLMGTGWASEIYPLTDSEKKRAAKKRLFARAKRDSKIESGRWFWWRK